jgi:adenine-specific DNA-methyltransferase
VAELMAGLLGSLPAAVRLIDAGAGAGALTLAFVRRACAQRSGVKSIHATACELDPAILPSLHRTLAECESLCGRRQIAFDVSVLHTDFVRAATDWLAGDLFGSAPPSFNLAIVNPPYKKINTDSPTRRTLRSVGLETSNLYAGFVGLLARLLEVDGQLVAITPRSFCNGPYFRSFREDMLRLMSLERLHVFKSRQAAFRSDSVLQENVIFRAVRGWTQSRTIIVSASRGGAGDPVSEGTIPFPEIVHPKDPERFIHIPSDDGHSHAKARLSGLPATLRTLGLSVSTGRVVEFRLKAALRPEPTAGTVPLIYPCHFDGGTVRWPKAGSRKPNAIVLDDTTRPWLVPRGLYLLTKRFSSKEERRRLVACILDPDDVDADWVGLENHVNYFHRRGAGLPKELALGLFAYLNSTVLDQFFRCFSGHTQVNATDLRKLPYPDRGTLDAIGVALERTDVPQAEIDQLVEHHLHGIEENRPKARPEEAAAG